MKKYLFNLRELVGSLRCTLGFKSPLLQHMDELTLIELILEDSRSCSDLHDYESWVDLVNFNIEVLDIRQWERIQIEYDLSKMALQQQLDFFLPTPFEIREYSIVNKELLLLQIK